MSDRTPCTIIEIDMDFCTRTYGSAPCAAVLGTTGARKCFNGWQTCQNKANYEQGSVTLRFAEPMEGLPKGQTYFPVVRSIKESSSTVNIAGADPDLSALGRRATLAVDFDDFVYHDRLTDKYQAERISGAAQADGIGYDPSAGTFFGKLRARWPFYAGRPCRVVSGYLHNGELIDAQTRHYVITDLKGFDGRGRIRLEAEDVLNLAGNDKAVAPLPSNGYLAAPIEAGSGSLTLTPAGIGEGYPGTGRATIGGSEIVSFTRSGDVLTLTGRGLNGTQASPHDVDTHVQVNLYVQNMRPDDYVAMLLRDYTPIPDSFVPLVSKWAPEITRWQSSFRIYTEITKPTGIAALIGELSVLGVSFWWDGVAQEIGLKTVRPPDTDTVYKISDKDIKSIILDDRDKDRITETQLKTVQINPVNALSQTNFRDTLYTIDADVKNPNAYGDTKIRTILCRLFDRGVGSRGRVLSIRLLKRFGNPPARIRMVLDARKRDISLTDVVELTSDLVTDETGQPIPSQWQVISTSEPRKGHEIELVLQAYIYLGRYAYVLAPTAATYGTATDEQKRLGGFIAPNTHVFPDGSGPYQII